MAQSVGTLNAENAVVAKNLFGDVIFQRAEKPATDFILPFDLDSAAGDFVGRDAVFAALDAFARDNPGGYFEIVADAGIGKSALAAEIARRRKAIAFLASASRGTQRAEQFLTHTSAELVARYDLGRATLPADVAGSATVLVQFLRQAAAGGRAIWVVVDALDEAEAPPPGANPLLLPPDLPRGVFIVVTRRDGSMLAGPSTPVRRYEMHRDDAEQTADIAAFIRRRAACDARIGHAVATVTPDTTVDDFVRALTDAADGNFVYVSFVLADISQTQPPGTFDISHLPNKLVGYYDQFWKRMTRARDESWDTWKLLHKPVLDRLAVAAEAVTSAWLSTQVLAAADEIEARVLQPWDRVLVRGQRAGTPTWRVTHRSFADYLADTGKVNRPEANAAVAAAYVDRLGDSIGSWDEYGLRHVVTHLADAVDGGPDPERSVARLARVVADPRLLQRQLTVVDAARVEHDLERVRALVAASTFAAATFLLIPIAVALVRLRRELVKPDTIFTAARNGDVTAAEHLLELLGDELDAEWHDVLALTIAWLAADAAPNDAMALRDRLRARIGGSGSSPQVVDRLLCRLGATLDGAPEPASKLGEPADANEARLMIDRLAGAGIRTELRSDEQLRDKDHYLSAADGPPLVALAAAEADIGKPLFQRYVDIHAGYGYPQYRSASLWQLLSPLLEHPDAAWVREMLVRFGVALMGPARGEFLEGLEIALLTQKARTGDRAASAALDQRREAALEASEALPPGAGTASARPTPLEREGDVWAIHRRRLAALTESAVRLDLGAAVTSDLVAAAMRIVGGYAGFTAPAYLTLSESASLAPPDDGHVDRVRWLQIYALRAAHNIRDPVFCARMTARVNAMRERWWPAPDEQRLADVGTALAESPLDPAFTALHRIGEEYENRTQDDLPAVMRSARTLRELAEVYQRPLPQFQAVNDADWHPDHELKDKVVNVPDPGFPPLLAARLAASALAAGDGMDGMIRRLLPVTGADTTALGTTLSRLLLAAPVDDADQRHALYELAANPLVTHTVSAP